MQITSTKLTPQKRVSAQSVTPDTSQGTTFSQDSWRPSEEQRLYTYATLAGVIPAAVSAFGGGDTAQLVGFGASALAGAAYGTDAMDSMYWWKNGADRGALPSNALGFGLMGLGAGAVGFFVSNSSALGAAAGPLGVATGLALGLGSAYVFQNAP